MILVFKVSFNMTLAVSISLRTMLARDRLLHCTCWTCTPSSWTREFFYRQAQKHRSPLFGDFEQFSFTIGIKENCIKHKELQYCAYLQQTQFYPESVNLVDPFTGPKLQQVRLPKRQRFWVLRLNIFERNSHEIPFQVKSRHLYCDVRLQRTQFFSTWNH